MTGAVFLTAKMERCMLGVRIHDEKLRINTLILGKMQQNNERRRKGMRISE
jgi:hypothetical protein